MDEDFSICLKGFTTNELQYVKGWDGFVSPEGLFYKVIERNRNTPAHDVFAEYLSTEILHTNIKEIQEKFIVNNDKIRNHKLSYKDIIIHVFGFVNYEYEYKALNLTGPDYYINRKKITNEQINTISKLIIINKDSNEAINFLFDDDRKSNNHELQYVKTMNQTKL